jgi:signal transduction histidine kinase
MVSTQKRPGQRSFRLRLALVVMFPLVSLLALWGFAASVTLTNAIQEHNVNGEDKIYGGPAQNLGEQLILERLYAIQWLGSGGHAPETTMLAQFRDTEQAVTAFRTATQMSMGSIPASARPVLASFERQLNRLPSIRAAIESGRLSELGAFGAYNAISDVEFNFFSKILYVNDVGLYQQEEASVEAGHALDMALRAVTLISGSLANGGHMSTAEHLAFTQSVASQRLLMTGALQQLTPSVGSGYSRAVASRQYKSFTAIENRVMATPASRRAIPVSSAPFLTSVFTLFRSFQTAERQDRFALSNQASSTGNRLLLELLLAGGLGLLAVLLSIYLVTRFARRTSRELRGLQGEAIELATDRLPRVVERLSQGEEVDVAEEAAPPTPARITEIARVSEAFGMVQQTAVESAVGQARLRRGVSQVFRNLAWRSQSLLHRQLSLLDVMERKATDPDALEELFRLDHLTTRMRRHAEGLIILSGAEPGRAWREPVPILDVLRGAIAEIEDYKRVSVVAEDDDAVVGSAVADLIHLLAELIENATFYSPTTTEVAVRAGRVANGFVVEIEDRGIGIGAEELERINERLANPPEFDPVNSDQLGLFVVARLAARQNIKVTIRQSPYGGTAVVVLLPHAIVVARGRAFAGLSGGGPDWPPATGEPAGIAPAPWRARWDNARSRVGVVSVTVVQGTSALASAAEGTAAEGTAAGGTAAGGTAAEGTAAGGTAAGGTAAGGTAAEGTAAGGTAAEGTAAEGTAAEETAVILPSGLPVRRKAGNGTGTAGHPGAARGLPDSAEEGLPDSGAGAETPGLPRRVRQASLAPELKADPAAVPGEVQSTDPAGELKPAGSAGEAQPPDPSDGRSAEHSRSLVDALQFGWRRGLTDADQYDVWTPAASPRGAEPADEPDDRSAAPPPRTAGGGD